MKAHPYRVLFLSVILGSLTLNNALADEATPNQVSTRSVIVSFNDLNLANPAGYDHFYHRVKHAAYKVCGVKNMKVSLDITRKNRECVASSIDRALEKISDARLTALHQFKLEESQHS